MTIDFKPQLAQSTPPSSLFQYARDDDYYFEEKLDGQRLIAYIVKGKVSFLNRQGEAKQSGKFYAFKRQFEWATIGTVAFDGEMIDGTFWIFDMPVGAKEGNTLQQRRSALEYFFGIWEPDSCIQLLPSIWDQVGKLELAKTVLEEGGEGLVIKDRRSSYHPGKRHNSWLKCKFTRDIDCVVIDVGVDGKRNLQLGCYDDKTGSLVDIGFCTALAGDGPRVCIGNVVTVQFLGWKGHRLIQPTRPRIRLDKSPTECLISQLNN